MVSYHIQNDYPWPSTVNVANFISAKLCFKNKSTNYKIWKEQMLCLIEGQDLLGYIDGSILPPPPETHQENYLLWRRSDRLLKGWVLGSLDETLVSEVVAMTTARDVWLELENKFSPTIAANMQYKKGEEASNSITHELSQLRKARPRGCIYRVHESLRNVNSKAYEPYILAIGPYHRDKDKYKMMEEHKLRYLQSILNRTGKSVDIYISAIAECEEEARNCYAEPISLSQDEFIKMLVLDGCFIIELALKFVQLENTYSNDPICGPSWIIGSLTSDLILVENQIPFIVLLKLFDLIVRPPNQYCLLMELLLSFCGHLFPDKGWEKQKNISPFDVKHLLNLIHSRWSPESLVGAVNINEDCPSESTSIHSAAQPANDSESTSIHSAAQPANDSKSTSIHSAAELKNANVRFRKNESCDSLFEVKFQNGTLLMPPLRIDDRTEGFFRNLIAYEQYFVDGRRNYVTDYVNFIDRLINSSKDVDVLTKCGIINNWLGDNEVIASMFNRLMDSVEWSSKHVYRKTFEEINDHYNNRWNGWVTVLKRDYCSSPWRCISIFAALVLLALTIVQAVCSILQFV